MRFLVVAVALASTSTTLGACAHAQEQRALIEWDPASVAGAVIVIRDVRVFPATAADVVLEHHDVVVQGGRITAVRPTGDTHVLPVGATIIEGRGRTLLPGLVDAHGHTQVTGGAPWYRVLADPEHTLAEFLYSGTTTVHDMGGRLDEALALRARVERGEIAGPRMRIAGPFLIAPGGYPESYMSKIIPGPMEVKARLFDPYFVRLDHPREARRAVRRLAAAGVDHIKVAMASTPDGTPVIDSLVLETITHTAHELGLKVMAHVDTAANARAAVEHGVDALVHGVHSTDLSDDDARAIGARRPLVAPTLLTFDRLWQLRHDALALTAMENETVSANLRASLVEGAPEGYELDPELLAWLEHLHEHRDARLHGNVAKLRANGARILVGTDGHGSTASFPAGIHEEMRLLVEAGVPAGEVLMGATSWSARLSDPSPTYGTIAPGLDADLLLVEGNPLEDITATSRIVDVIARGRRVKRLVP